MAREAELAAVLAHNEFVFGAMNVMVRLAVEFPLHHRVMRRHVEIGANVHVTSVTEIGRLILQHLSRFCMA